MSGPREPAHERRRPDAPPDAGPATAGQRPLHAATWLAMGLAFAYLAVMTALMWLFENARVLEHIEQTVADPGRLSLWLLIVLSAVLVFAAANWALAHVRVRVLASQEAPGELHQIDARGPAWALLGTLALALLGTGGYVLQAQEDAVRRAQFHQIAVVGAAKARIAGRWLDERRRDMRALLANVDFVANVGALTDAAVPADLARLPALDALVRAGGFVGAVVVDTGAAVVYSVPDDHQARPRCQALASTPVEDWPDPLFLSRAFDPEDSAPQIAAIGAVRRSARMAKEATVCLRIDLARSLLPALSGWPLPAQSGEVLLGRLDGDDVLVLNTPHDHADRWSLQRWPGARAAWEAALKATALEQLHERDTAGGRTWLRAAFAVPDSPWLLVARMDAEEADQLQSHGQRRVAVGAGFLFIIALAAAMLGWARGTTRAEDLQAARARLLQQLADLAHQDELTGLPRRALVEDRLRMAIAQAAREGGSLGVLFIDLDDFKTVNDRHGHAAGDAVLAAVAGRMAGALRQGDTLGRLGGDEFLAVLPHCGQAQRLDELATRLDQAASEPIMWQGQELRVRASIGSAIWQAAEADPAPSTDLAHLASELMAAADAVMYRSKRARAEPGQA